MSERPIGRRRGDRIAGASAATQKMVEQASEAARSDRPVVLSGPSGSGREHLARAIHAWSSRAAQPLELFRAGGVPEVQHTRELFGAREGGEPLIDGSRFGALERSAGGTLLITDAERLAASTREALAQALKNGSFSRESEAQSVPLEARLLLTSNGEVPLLPDDLGSLVIRVPALSERPEDILPLAVHFLALFAEEDGAKAVGFTTDARQALMEEPWEGNVRELRERVRQALRLAGDGAISVESLVLASDRDEVPSFKEAKRSFETRYVKSLLRRCGGNISRAARLAKKDRKDFYDVIRRTGVDPQEFRR